MSFKINNNIIIDSTASVGVTGKVTKLTLSEGNVITLFEQAFQGTVAGYSAGGVNAPGTVFNTIDKYPFATDANATDVGDLTSIRYTSAGSSSQEHGYNATGGGGPVTTNTVEKFSFASGGNSSIGHQLINRKIHAAGISSSVSGYVAGGYGYPPPPSVRNQVSKYPFASNASGTVGAAGITTNQRYYLAGNSSTEKGYVSGGEYGSRVNIIESFPFATDTNATDVGDLTQARDAIAGISSTTHGYNAGGNIPPAVNVIDRFPFATNANATDVGDLTSTKRFAFGSSSFASGYTAGGYGPPTLNTIDKFPFATNANSADVGDITVARFQGASQQD